MSIEYVTDCNSVNSFFPRLPSCGHAIWSWDGEPTKYGQANYVPTCVRPWPSLASGQPLVKGGLVSTSIFQQGAFRGSLKGSSSSSESLDCIQIFPKSLRVRRPSSPIKNKPLPPDRGGIKISGFSDGSRRRLRFTALNAFPSLVSQFALTYHKEWPTDGRIAKKHLNVFLTSVRRHYPGISYLWIMEFQQRGAPHFHIFFSCPPSDAMRRDLARLWCRVTSPGDETALRFHEHVTNFIKWDMGSGAYLCKYLDKEAQKAVPNGYTSFGRFWGNSRSLVPDPTIIPMSDLSCFDQVDTSTGECVDGEKTILRWLGRLAEKQTRGFSRFRKRAARFSYTMLCGASAYRQIESYLYRLMFSRPPVGFEPMGRACGGV